MSRAKTRPPRHPFPQRRPEVSIAPSRAKPFAVDCRELPGWCAPEVGTRVLTASYDAPDWKLSNVSEVSVLRPASVHGLDCAEIEEKEYDRTPRGGWRLFQWTMFARITDHTVGWLATDKVVDGKRILYTFLDEDFDENWGELPRLVEDRGRFVAKKDGSYRQRRSKRHRADEARGAGVFRVRIAGKAFTCLRVIDVDLEPDERSILLVTYLTRRGRVLLSRRYNARMWAVGDRSVWSSEPWDKRFPDAERMVVDGVEFVHWYDIMTDSPFRGSG